MSFLEVRLVHLQTVSATTKAIHFKNQSTTDEAMNAPELSWFLFSFRD